MATTGAPLPSRADTLAVVSADPGGSPGDDVARKDAEWAAKADRSAGNRPGVQPAAAPGSTRPAGDPSLQTYRTPRHLRTSSGPRFSGRGVLAVFGLLGVLLTVGIMVFLFMKVLDGTDAGGVDTGQPGADSPDAPGLPAVPLAPGVPDGAQPGTGGATDAAAEAACDQERANIELAIESYTVLHGDPPGSLQVLVDDGLLEPPEGGLSHELSGDGTVVGTGGCAGG